MREIVSPLVGFRSPFGVARRGTAPPSLYLVGGIMPRVVADFAGRLSDPGTYLLDGRRSTFDALWSHSRFGNAMQRGADGTQQWPPHNILQGSAYSDGKPPEWSTAFSTGTFEYALTNVLGGVPAIQHDQITSGRSPLLQAHNLVEGARYRLSVYFDADRSFITSGHRTILGVLGVEDATFPAGRFATIDDLGGTSGRLEIEFTTGADTVVQVRVGMAVLGDAVGRVVHAMPTLHRVDFGGMAEVPLEQRVAPSEDAYVATSPEAVYRPRLTDHEFDGEWVRSGLLSESRSAPNLIPFSEDLEAGDWSGLQAFPFTDAFGMPIYLLTADFNDTTLGLTHPVTYGTGNASLAATMKADFGTVAEIWLGDGINAIWARFRLSTGVVLDSGATGTGVLADVKIEPLGDGYWYCYIAGSGTGDGATTTAAIYPGARGSTFGSILVGSVMCRSDLLPISHIPTTGAQATRLSEELTVAQALYDPAGYFAVIDLEEGVNIRDQSALFNVEGAQAGLFLFIDDTGADPIIGLTVTRFDASEPSIITLPIPAGAQVPLRIAVRVSRTDFNIAVNGVAGTAGAIAGDVDLTGALPQFRPMGRVRMYRQGAGAITDQDLIDITGEYPVTFAPLGADGMTTADGDTFTVKEP